MACLQTSWAFSSSYFFFISRLHAFDGVDLLSTIWPPFGQWKLSGGIMTDTKACLWWEGRGWKFFMIKHRIVLVSGVDQGWMDIEPRAAASGFFFFFAFAVVFCGVRRVLEFSRFPAWIQLAMLLLVGGWLAGWNASSKSPEQRTLKDGTDFGTWRTCLFWSRGHCWSPTVSGLQWHNKQR